MGVPNLIPKPLQKLRRAVDDDTVIGGAFVLLHGSGEISINVVGAPSQADMVFGLECLKREIMMNIPLAEDSDEAA